MGDNMNNKSHGIKTLQEAIIHFSDQENCFNALVKSRWPKGVTCPTCGRNDVRFISTRKLWECKAAHPRKQFSVKIGTIFEESPIGLDKWLAAMWMVANCKNGISSYEVGRALGVTQKTAWFMLQRIRLAMQNGSLMKIGGKGGPVEADETYIGGKARNMHFERKLRMLGGGVGTAGKAAVLGLLQRHGKGKSKIIVQHITNTSREDIQPIIRKSVKAGSELYTDSHSGYDGLNDEYFHEFVNHAETYARGKVHTNGLENFWSLLKRGLRGTYVSVEPFHLFRYLDEQAFRYNNRTDMNDFDRFSKLLKMVTGKRVTYSKLTGKPANDLASLW
jgi:transposase-like protein